MRFLFVQWADKVSEFYKTSLTDSTFPEDPAAFIRSVKKIIFQRSMESCCFMKLVFLVLLSSLALCNSVRQFGTDESCNEYIDKVIRDLKNEKDYFEDPYKIPEKSYFISKKLLFVNYTGEASLSDGYIFGLTSLHRDGDVIVDRKKSVHLKVYLGAGELKMNCNGKVKLMGHGPTVKVEAKITYISMKLDFIPNSKSGEKPRLTDFQIEDVKGVKINVSGLGPLNFVIKAYIKIIQTFFKRVVRYAVQSAIKKFMEDKFENYVIPQECLESAY